MPINFKEKLKAKSSPFHLSLHFRKPHDLNFCIELISEAVYTILIAVDLIITPRLASLKHTMKGSIASRRSDEPWSTPECVLLKDRSLEKSLRDSLPLPYEMVKACDVDPSSLKHEDSDVD